MSKHAIPRIAGDWTHLYDPNPTKDHHPGDWYTNDHCFVREETGQWHAFGITGWRPPDCWANEQQLFHASGDALTQGAWKEHDYALVNDQQHGERYLWAPYIIRRGDTYHMFYAGGSLIPDAESFCAYCGLHLATSTDLFNWKRHDLNPLFVDCGNARDPFVLEVEGRYLLYYTRTFNEVDHRSCIAVRQSTDLLHWSGPTIAHIQPLANHFAGDAESPMVIGRDGRYYLFLCLACTGYHTTRVFVSDDPLNFPRENQIAELEAHGSEILHEPSTNQWSISTTGWDRQGLYVAPLLWD